MSAPYIWRIQCAHYKEYQGIVAPTCGCQKCNDIYRAVQQREELK